jgi:hypothetical protein
MSLTNYLKRCEKTIPGNSNRLFVAKFEEIDAITFDSNKITAITMVDTGSFFSILDANFDTVSYTSEGTANRGFFAEQTLAGWFYNKSPELDAVIDELRDAAVCGLVIIRQDGNGNYWLSGTSPVANLAANRPYLSVTTNFGSGQTIQDIEEGNRYEISFGRISGTEEYMLSGSATADAMDSGSAGFVNWPE